MTPSVPVECLRNLHQQDDLALTLGAYGRRGTVPVAANRTHHGGHPRVKGHLNLPMDGR